MKTLHLLRAASLMLASTAVSAKTLEVTVSDIRNDKGNILVMAKVAGQEQVVSVIDVQGVGRISRARVDQLVALRIPGSTILQVVLVVAALLIFVVSGYFLGHFDHSF